MNTIKIDKNKTQMIAHRGVSGLEKENTVPAFVAAGNRSYYGIECDIYVTLDKKVVVIHDDNLLRVAGCDRGVKGSTLEELRSYNLFDVDSSEKKEYYKIPLLEEYLEICKRYEKKAIVEVKDHISQEEIDIILEVVERSGYLNETVFISFYPWNLFKIRAKYPNQPVQFLTSEMNEKLMNLCFENNFDLDINYNIVTKELIEMFHSHNLIVNTWTVNDKETALKLIEMGIDFITTNILE